MCSTSRNLGGMQRRAPLKEQTSKPSFGSLFPQFDRRDIWSLVWLALVIRLVFLLLGLQAQDLSGVTMWANDSHTYVDVARYWLNGDSVGKQQMLLAGPGYGFILACFIWLFGTNPWPPLFLNIGLGILAPAVVYLLALTLIQRRSVALLAGLICCISWTGVSLSVSQLTDQPFLRSTLLLFFCL
jgi:hypothetical protein